LRLRCTLQDPQNTHGHAATFQGKKAVCVT